MNEDNNKFDFILIGNDVKQTYNSRKDSITNEEIRQKM